jgi:hypothetical protein
MVDPILAAYLSVGGVELQVKYAWDRVSSLFGVAIS